MASAAQPVPEQQTLHFMGHQKQHHVGDVAPGNAKFCPPSMKKPDTESSTGCLLLTAPWIRCGGY